MKTTTIRRKLLATSLALAAGIAAGCGGNGDDGPCVVGEACEDGICEEVPGGEPACFAPVVVRGTVRDMVPLDPVDDAMVVALDADGAARSDAVRTASDGTFSIPMATPRNADGTPVAERVTLRVDAAGFLPFPRAPRTALPIDLADGAPDEDAGEWVVRNAATDVLLTALAGGPWGTVSGRIDHDLAPGMLVVAAQGDRAAATAVTDRSGRFVLFNLPAGATTVGAWRAGLTVVPGNVTVVADEDVAVVLKPTTEGLATVTGGISFADAPGGSVTSIVLVLDSTYDEDTRRGEAPVGLRAGGVTGAFSIPDVPPGRYVVLAAFENDGLVRDPDETIGGTATARIEVTGQAATVDTGESFKITGALAVRSPGAEGLEEVQAVPTFRWADDAAEDGYEIRVFDAAGTVVHENLDVPRVTGPDTVEYTWAGASLLDGMMYQFRAFSWAVNPKGVREYRSATEDLRGVFLYRAPAPAVR